MLEKPMYWDGFRMNDRSLRDFTQQGWWIRVTSVDGLWDSDIRDERVVRPGQDGERSSQLFYSGKTVTISGYCVARDLTNLRIAQRELQGAFGPLEAKQFAWQLWNELPVVITGKKTQPIKMTEDETQLEPSRWRRGFVVQFRADDGRSYSQTVKVFDLLASGGSGRFRQYDILGGRERLRDYSAATIPRTRTYAGQGTNIHQQVDNQGNAPSYPITDLCGMQINPAVYNLTTNQVIKIGSLADPFVIAAGDFLRINHKTGQMLLNGVSEISATVNVLESVFWALAPGINDVVLIPYSGDSGAEGTLRYRDAYL